MARLPSADLNLAVVMPCRIRPCTPADLPAVLAVQAECYIPAMNEPGEVILARLAAAPAFAWVAEAAGEVGAYLMTYPSRIGKVTPLGADFAPAADADCLYLHDLAVSPRWRGSGAGGRLVSHALQDAARRGLQQAALVCVQAAGPFWEKLDFADFSGLTVDAQAALATYPGGGRYMVRRSG